MVSSVRSGTPCRYDTSAAGPAAKSERIENASRTSTTEIGADAGLIEVLGQPRQPIVERPV